MNKISGIGEGRLKKLYEESIVKIENLKEVNLNVLAEKIKGISKKKCF